MDKLVYRIILHVDPYKLREVQQRCPGLSNPEEHFKNAGVGGLTLEDTLKLLLQAHEDQLTDFWVIQDYRTKEIVLRK